MAGHYITSNSELRSRYQRMAILDVISASRFRTTHGPFTISARDFVSGYDDLFIYELEEHLASLYQLGLAKIKRKEAGFDPWNTVYMFQDFKDNFLEQEKRATAKEIDKIRKKQGQGNVSKAARRQAFAATIKDWGELAKSIHAIIVLVGVIATGLLALNWHHVADFVQQAVGHP